MEKILISYAIGYIFAFIVTFFDSKITVKNDGTSANSLEDAFFASFFMGFGSWITVFVWLFCIYDNFSPIKVYKSIQIRCGKVLSAEEAYKLSIKKQRELKRNQVNKEVQKVMGEIRDALDRGDYAASISENLLDETKEKIKSMGYTIEGEGRFITINFNRNFKQ